MGLLGFVFSSGTVCCSVALGTFERRTWKREQRWKDRKKWTSVKCPVLNFYGTKTYVLIFYFQLQSLFPFFSGVLVNGHLYVNMKNQDQVLIDGLLENHVGLAFV